jgi:hypothetical protein
VLCLFGFIVAALLAIVPSALADEAANVPADASGSFFPTRFRQPGDRGAPAARARRAGDAGRWGAGNEFNLRTAGRSVDRPSRRSETQID